MALADMDRETEGNNTVSIQAKDMGGQVGGLAGTTSVHITLGDVNDNPPVFDQSKTLLFPSFHFSFQLLSFYPPLDPSFCSFLPPFLSPSLPHPLSQSLVSSLLSMFPSSLSPSPPLLQPPVTGLLPISPLIPLSLPLSPLTLTTSLPMLSL